MRCFLVLYCLLCATLQVQAAPVITTLPEWNGTDNAQFFGTTGSATYGQVFTPTGSDLILQDFSLWLDSLGNQLQYRAYVQEYNLGTNQAVGNILFTSATLLASAAAGFNQISINTGGLLLNSGSSYIAYFSTSGVPQANLPGAQMGWIANNSVDPNARGFRFSNSGNVFNPVTGVSTPWFNLGPNNDLTFVANFAAVGPTAPELDAGSALTPIFLGLALLGVAQRKRRDSSAGISVSSTR